ncbi:MAG TPA: hypothetical protein VGX23_36950 [Actinocrinis sp.]|nr:hypothetical protein [Actinocrinis sp.]
MSSLTPAAVLAAVHARGLAASECSVLVLGAGAVLVLVWLGVAARRQARRLSRSTTRALSGGRRPRAGDTRRMVARAGRSRRASWRFRKALLLSVLLAAAYVWTRVHTHTR